MTRHNKKLAKFFWSLNFARTNYPKIKKLFDFMAPFYGWGSTASRLESLRGDSLLFTTKSVISFKIMNNH